MAARRAGPGDARRATRPRRSASSTPGYDWRRRAMAVVRGLGFADSDLDRPLRTFSGGELTRGSLARTLSGDPDLLLLDEPTNHLDVASLEWLEQQLTSLDAAIVLVAHDRWFLESVGTAVLELEAGRSRFFAGPWHAWRKERAARELALGRAIERQQAEIERLERFVTPLPRGHPLAPGAVQGQAARQDRPARAGSDGRARPGVRLRAPPRGRAAWCWSWSTPRSAAGDRTLIEDAELWLERGEHVALVGPNGSGKTTLIETLAGQRDLPSGQAAARAQRRARVPVAARRGDRARGHRARGGAARDRPDSRQGTRAARAGSSSRAPTPRRRSRCSRAASCGACRWRSSSRRARTC